MGQYEVLECLKKNKGKWLLTREIMKQTGCSRSSITIGLGKLHAQKEVKFRGRKCPNGTYNEWSVR